MKLTTAHIRQAFQTATAGVLAMYLSRFLGLPEGYWAAITAMIVLQASLGAALKESWVRVAATAIGAALAIPFVTYLGRGLIVFGAAVFVTVLLCSLLRLQAGLRVAATTVAIIMLIPRPGRPWEPGIHRFLEVSFGIIVALVVAKFVSPTSALEDLRKSVAAAYLQLNSLFVALMRRFCGEPCDDVEKLHAALDATKRQIEDLQEQASYEVAFRFKNPQMLATIAAQAARIYRTLAALDLATSGPLGNELLLKMEPELGDLRARVESCLSGIAQALASENVAQPQVDIQPAAQAIQAKVAKLRNDPAYAEFPTRKIMGLDALCIALTNLSLQLADAQAMVREVTR
ncbi:MAG: FUSC family protein [Candidatus Acidiferrales bacterium]